MPRHVGMGFPGGSNGIESACNAGDLGSIPRIGDPLEKRKATHSSILAWRILWTILWDRKGSNTAEQLSLTEKVLSYLVNPPMLLCYLHIVQLSCSVVSNSLPGLPIHHQLPAFIQTHVHRVSDAIEPSHPLSSPSPPAPNPSQHESFPMSQPFT